MVEILKPKYECRRPGTSVSQSPLLEVCCFATPYVHWDKGHVMMTVVMESDEHDDDDGCHRLFFPLVCLFPLRSPRGDRYRVIGEHGGPAGMWRLEGGKPETRNPSSDGCP